MNHRFGSCFVPSRWAVSVGLVKPSQNFCLTPVGVVCCVFTARRNELQSGAHWPLAHLHDAPVLVTGCLQDSGEREHPRAMVSVTSKLQGRTLSLAGVSGTADRHRQAELRAVLAPKETSGGQATPLETNGFRGPHALFPSTWPWEVFAPVKFSFRLMEFLSEWKQIQE